MGYKIEDYAADDGVEEWMRNGLRSQGRRLRGQRESVHSKILGGGDEDAYVPQNVRNI